MKSEIFDRVSWFLYAIANTIEAGENHPMPTILEETPTLAVLARAATQYDEDEFLNGSCHSLAYAMWLQNERRGSLLACMRVDYDPQDEVKEPFSVSYAHMCYQDPNGTIWDIGGKEADMRYEDERYEEFEHEDQEEFTKFEWIEIHPNNLFTFLQDWGATRKIEPGMIKKLCSEDTQSADERPKFTQNELFEAPENHFDLDKAPFDNHFYRSLSAMGFLHGKTQIDPSQKQHTLFV